MNATAFDPCASYDVFSVNATYTGMTNHEDFLRGHALLAGLPKNASDADKREREAKLAWFEDQGYRVKRSKRPAED